MADVVDESVNNLGKTLVGREEGERWRYTQKVSMALGSRVEGDDWWKAGEGLIKIFGVD